MNFIWITKHHSYCNTLHQSKTSPIASLNESLDVQLTNNFMYIHGKTSSNLNQNAVRQHYSKLMLKEVFSTSYTSLKTTVHNKLIHSYYLAI